MTYDSIQGMEYLDMVYNKAMRIYPPIGFLTRECVRETMLPIFPEPDAFKPERFSRENRAALDNTFMAFDKGNRLCVGTRHATLQVNSGLVHLLRHFSVRTRFNGDKINYSKQSQASLLPEVRSKDGSPK
ncbi:unnamed protein product, partial [Iphiclides podalirius]